MGRIRITAETGGTGPAAQAGWGAHSCTMLVMLPRDAGIVPESELPCRNLKAGGRRNAGAVWAGGAEEEQMKRRQRGWPQPLELICGRVG